MSDSTPGPVSNDPANDGYEIRNADDARLDARQKVGEEHEHPDGDVEGKDRTIGQRIHDAIEHVIPGHDSHDGH
ncbi:MAG: hypothetical protein ABI949_15050 [Ilumatobacteraceae bacterium]